MSKRLITILTILLIIIFIGVIALAVNYFYLQRDVVVPDENKNIAVDEQGDTDIISSEEDILLEPEPQPEPRNTDLPPLPDSAPEFTELEEKFFCFNDIENDIEGTYFYEEYLRRLYQCIGYNNIDECDANRDLISLVQSKEVDETISRCKNNSYGFQYVKTGDISLLNNIAHEELKNTYRAIRENDSSLCSFDFPSCNLYFNSECYSDEELLSYEEEADYGAFCVQSSFIDPENHCFRDDKTEVINKMIANKSLICQDIRSSLERLVNPNISCDQFNKDKNLIERLAYMRCINSVQSEINYCKDELERLTTDQVRYYIYNNCIYP